jgi:hypothetical protein
LKSAIIATATAIALHAGIAHAKPARCFTTDDGHYQCDFAALDGDGSFEITAAGYPSYQLLMDGPGVAFGMANFGDRYTALPGTYQREAEDPACWANSDTGTRICAW